MGSAVLTSSNATWPWSTCAPQTVITAELLGGGGGGGGATNNTEGAGGGGKGGAYVKVTITKGAETTLNITVGAGGTAGTNSHGGDGGASSIVQDATTRALAPGGQGGRGGTTSAGFAGGTTENGTVEYTGGTYYAGGNGAAGNIDPGNYSGGGGGAGGPSSAGSAASGVTYGAKGTGTWLNGNTYQSDGKSGKTSGAAGDSADDYGGGASGGYATSSTNRDGGVGGDGIVVLTWVDLVAATPTADTVTVGETGTQAVMDLGTSCAETVTVGETGTTATMTTPVRVELREGATVRATRSIADSLSTSWATVELDLTTEERNAVTDWTALRVAISATGRQTDVSWVELYTPLSGAGTLTPPTQSDTVTLGETVSTVLDPLFLLREDTLTVSETGTRAACDERATPDADTVTVGEATATWINPLECSSADTLTLSETGTRAACDERATPEADTVTVGETAVVVLDPLVAADSETLTLSEASPAGFDPLLPASSETVTLGEVDPAPAQRIDYAGEDIPCVITDQGTVTLGDSGLGVVTPIFVAEADTVTVEEAAPAALTPELATGTETVTVDDAVEAALQLGVAVSETVTVGEATDTLLTPLLRYRDETITVSDTWGTFDVELFEADHRIAARHVDTLSADWTTFEWALTTDERNDVSDWTQLRVWLTVAGRRVDVSWVELATPAGIPSLVPTGTTETVTLSDSVTAAMGLLAAAADTVTLWDPATVGERPTIQVYAVTITVPFAPEIPLEVDARETVAFTDDVVPFQVIYARRNEFVTLSDAGTARHSELVTASADTLTLSEGVAATSDLLVAVADTVTWSETIPLGAWPEDTLTLDETGTDADRPSDLYSPADAETLTLSEAAAGELTPLQATIADQGGLTVTDAVMALLDPLRAVLSDTVTLTDAATGDTGLNVRDTATVSESGTVEYWRPITVTDVATAERVRPGAYGEDDLHVTDSVRATVGIIEARRSDGVVLEDIGWGARSGEYREALREEVATVGERGQVEYVKAITVTDSATAMRVDETRFVYRVETITLSETVTLPADAAVRETLTWDEGGGADFWDVGVMLTISDTATVVLDPLVPSGSETLTVSDAVVPFLADLAVGRTDGVVLSDAASGTVPPVVVVTDQTVVSDVTGTRAQRVEVNTWLAPVRDLLLLYEQVNAEMALEVVRGETLTLTETGVGELDVLDAPGSDTATLSETVTVVVDPLLAAVTQRIDVSDEVFRLSATGDDTVTLSEAASGALSEGVLVPSERTWRVPAETRTYRIPLCDRTHTVPAEDRTWIVHAEDRTWTSEEEA